MPSNYFQTRRLGAKRTKSSRKWKLPLSTLLPIALVPLRFLNKWNPKRRHGWSEHFSWKKMILQLMLIGFFLLLAYFAWLWFTMPDISNPRSLLASQSTAIVDRNGVELYRLFQEEDRTFIEGNQIPEHMKHAIIAIEDKRYYDRGCLDMRAIARVIFSFGSAGGGSTLTRQLARNALNLKRENVYNRKLREFVLGCQMEARMTKDELLVLYLNWIPFGQNAYGIEQASQKYFGISANELTIAQSAILASLPQRPSYFSPYGSHVRTQVDEEIQRQIAVAEINAIDDIPESSIRTGLMGNLLGTGSYTLYIGGRADQVLQNMQDQEFISETDRQQAIEELKTMEFQSVRESIRAPHFVLWIREQLEEMFEGTAEEGILERGGLTIETTLDWELQEIAEDIVEKQREGVLERFGANNMALIAIDPFTRHIVTYVGNMDFADTENGGKIDMIRVPRQPGSSFKPFVYAAAFEKGYSPATVLYDVETKIGEDTPQNFDGEFFGPLTIRQALGASRNIPAAKGFFLGGGEENILRLVASMGAPTPLKRRNELNEKREGGFGYGWPLALGAAETPLLEMANIYSTLADNGRYKEPLSILRIIDKHGNILYEAEEDQTGQQVLDERIVYQVTSVLSDEWARPEEYWRTQLTVPGYQTAAKTGTSNKCLEINENTGACKLRKPDNAWLMGYTPELVIGAWAGNADSSAMYLDAGGLNTASPLWRDFAIRAHRNIASPKTQFTIPDGVVQPQISLLSGELPTDCTPIDLRRADVFLKERAPSQGDPACVTVMVDKLTGLLASDECPEDAQEEQSFFQIQSILPQRWPLWEEAVQKWSTEQMELWNADESHSGSLLKLPAAPTEHCDPALTPGRLIAPELTIQTPRNGGKVPFPAFTPQIKFSVGSEIREVRYMLDGKRVAVWNEPPFQRPIRVPRSVKKSGKHTLEVILEDEYFNVVQNSVSFTFGEDIDPPSVFLRLPSDNAVYPTGGTMTIRAEAEDTEGGIKYVQFYLDGTLLSTKPKEPYALEYILDVPPGSHTVRAVAEDMAEHTAQDSVQIIVQDGAPQPEERERSRRRSAPELIEEEVEEITEETVEESNERDPAILEPATSIEIERGEIIDIRALLPSIGSQFIEAHLYVQSTGSDDQDTILHVTDGDERIYTRSWKSNVIGTHMLILETMNDQREIVRWGEVELRVN